jgi:hypothetical protein
MQFVVLTETGSQNVCILDDIYLDSILSVFVMCEVAAVSCMGEDRK